jgi:proline iminopeptidase
MAFPVEKEFFVHVDGAKLFCRTFGKSNSPIIVMHGGPGLGHDHLLPQLAEIGAFSFATFYDQRGTGKSTSDDDWQSDPFQTYVRDVDQLRETLGLKTVSLLGHSWGGILASLYALAYPQHVDKMIYINSVPLSSADYMAFVKHRSQIVNTYKDELTAIRESPAFSQGDPKTVEKYYRIYFRNYFAKPELANMLTLTMRPEAAINNFKIYDLFYNYTANNSFDLYEGLKALNKQSLIIACDKDVIPLHYMQHLHKSIPSSKFVLIKDSGHFPYIDQPDILFKTLNDFIAKK